MVGKGTDNVMEPLVRKVVRSMIKVRLQKCCSSYEAEKDIPNMKDEDCDDLPSENLYI